MSFPQIQLPFAGGLNENVDARHLQPNEFETLENVVFANDGSLDKRRGFDELTPAAAMTSNRRLAVFAGELYAFSADRLWAYNDTAVASGDDFIDRGVVPEATVQRTQLSQASDQTYFIDSFTSGGVTVCVTADIFAPTRLNVWVYDADTGALLSHPALAIIGAAAVESARVGVLGSTVMVFFVTGANLNYSSATLASITTTNTGGFSAPVTISTDVNTAAVSPWIGLYCTTTYAWLAHATTTATTGRGLRVDASGTTVTATWAIANSTIQDVAVYAEEATGMWTIFLCDNGTNSDIYLVSTNTVCAFVAAATAATTTGRAYRASIARLASNTIYPTWSIFGDNTNYYRGGVFWRPVTDALANITATKSHLGVVLISQLFLRSGKLYALWGREQPRVSNAGTGTGPWVTALSPSPQTLAIDGAIYLMEYGSTSATQARWVANVAPMIVNQTGFAAATVMKPASVTASSTDNYNTPILAVRSQVRRLGIDRVEISFNDTQAFNTAELGYSMYFGATNYDNGKTSMTGFPWAPTITATALGGAGNPNGTYLYKAVYARIRANGDIEYSGESNQIQVVTGGAFQVNVTVCCNTLSAMESSTDADNISEYGYVLLYRTTAGGSIFYRVASEPFNTPTIKNSITAGFLTITDNVADATLTGGTRPILYTTQGFTNACVVPSFYRLISSDNRIWGIAEDRKTVWFSQEYLGGDAPTFATAYTIPILDTTDKLTAIAELDGRKILFTANDIYVITGAGPSGSNTGSDISTPQRLPFSIGCTTWRSLVLTEEGLWFQSSRGIELLTRGLELAPFEQLGAKVTRTVTTYPTCTSAVWLPGEMQVRFTFTSTDSTATQRDGRTVVYYPRFKRWSTHRYLRSQSDTSSAGAVSAVFFDPVGYIWSHDTTADALIKAQKASSSASAYLDYTSVWITKTVKSAWFKAADLQGWQKLRRIRLLGEYSSTHGLSNSLRYNYQTTTESHNYTEAVITALVTEGREQVDMSPGTMKAQAVQLEIADTAGGTPGTGRGVILDGIAFEVVPLPGGARNIAQTGRT